MKLTDAKIHLQRALEIESNYYGGDNPSMGILLHGLGCLMTELRELKAAEDYLHRALNMLEAADRGRDQASNSKIGHAKNSLGNVFLLGKDYQKAKAHFEEALKIRKKCYAEDHLDVAKTLLNLNRAKFGLKKQPDEDRDLARALEICKKNDGNPQSNILRAEILNIQGNREPNPENAIKLLEEAYSINEKNYKRSHPKVAIVLTNLGLQWNKLKRADKSIPLLIEALEIDTSYHGQNSIELTPTLHQLAFAYLSLQRDAEKAVQYLENCLRIEKKYHEEDHPQVAITSVLLVQGYRALGKTKEQKDLEEQKTLLENALKIFEREMPNHPLRAVARTYLTDVYRKLRIFFVISDEARQYFERLASVVGYHDQKNIIYVQEEPLKVSLPLFWLKQLGEEARTELSQALNVDNTVFSKIARD